MGSVIVIGLALETGRAEDLTLSEAMQIAERNCPMCRGFGFQPIKYTPHPKYPEVEYIEYGGVCYCTQLNFYEGLKKYRKGEK